MAAGGGDISDKALSPWKKYLMLLFNDSFGKSDGNPPLGWIEGKPIYNVV
jgi:hypothetical protein